VKKIVSLYLSGPDSLFPDGGELVARKAEMCRALGFVPVSALDAELVESEASEAMAREIYAANMALLRGADAVIANLTPFRGAGCDPAAAFEAGVASGMGKPVFAYMNVGDETMAEHRRRVLEWVGGRMDEEGAWRDADGAEIEDFGLPETLMLWAEARRLYVIVTPDIPGDLTGLELCLEAVKLYAD
jgi:nucleoside 2-deoxyribosyltransferase